MGRIAIYRLLRMGGGPHHSYPWKRLKDTRRAAREPFGARRNGCPLRECGSREQRRATLGPQRHSIHPIADASGLVETVTSFQRLFFKTCMCSSRATFLFYLFVLASSILCAASTAFAPQKLNFGQGDIALVTRDVAGMSRDVVMSGVLRQSATATTATNSLKVASTNSERRRSNAPSVADDIAIEFASPLTSASQL